jgi:hypothetical protein
MLVTESIPVWVRENTKKRVLFENLKNNTINNACEIINLHLNTPNPTWLALQSYRT